MKSITKMLVLSVFGLMVSSSVMADDDGPLRCDVLNIQIQNTTKSTCFLQDVRVDRRVVLANAPPSSIYANYSADFWMGPFFYGPDVTLTYDCNGKKIQFRSQQNACINGGAMTDQVVSADPGISAFANKVHSSFPRQYGIIMWRIIEN